MPPALYVARVTRTEPDRSPGSVLEPELVRSYASYSPRVDFRESDFRQRAIVGDRGDVAIFARIGPAHVSRCCVPSSRSNLLLRRSAGDESEFIAYIMDVYVVSFMRTS